jgi:hypothetical protein
MVAGGDDIRPKFEEFPGDIHGQPETGGSVFPIDHDEVDHMHIHEAVKPSGKGKPAGAANDITDEKDFQRFDSVTRGERKKVKGPRKNGRAFPLPFIPFPSTWSLFISHIRPPGFPG